MGCCDLSTWQLALQLANHLKTHVILKKDEHDVHCHEAARAASSCTVKLGLTEGALQLVEAMHWGREKLREKVLPVLLQWDTCHPLVCLLCSEHAACMSAAELHHLGVMANLRHWPSCNPHAEHLPLPHHALPDFLTRGSSLVHITPSGILRRMHDCGAHS